MQARARLGLLLAAMPRRRRLQVRGWLWPVADPTRAQFRGERELRGQSRGIDRLHANEHGCYWMERNHKRSEYANRSILNDRAVDIQCSRCGLDSGSSITGAPYAGTASNSFGQLNINWNGGTLPSNLNTAGEPSPSLRRGSTGDLIHLFIGATQQFTLDHSGNLTITGQFAATNITAGAGSQIAWTGRSQMYSPANGFINLTPSTGAGNALTALEFGVTTSSGPCLVPSGANLIVDQCNGTSPTTNTGLTVGALTSSGAVNLNGLTNAATGDYVCYNAGLIEYNTATCTLSLRKYKMDIAPLLKNHVCGFGGCLLKCFSATLLCNIKVGLDRLGHFRTISLRLACHFATSCIASPSIMP